MAKITPPADLHIAALEKKKLVEHVNLLAAGPGTPWEDRGHLGILKAIIQTCRMSLLSPMRLLHAIRRPESKADARSFALACGGLWSLSTLLHAILLQLYRGAQTPGYWLKVVLAAAVAPVLVWVLLELAATVLHKLNSMEPTSRAPAVLHYNVLAYNLGASALAPLPLIGPPVALVWILLTTILAARTRLHVSTAAAIVNSVLTALLVMVVLAGGYLLVRLLIMLLLGSAQ
ncbi:MAG TPA: hypothetical protein VNL70_02080 [Tepidisphaeraceae bacterium]|nr:hypothetical protein [Tepidisphaeraceae bacterium]